MKIKNALLFFSSLLILSMTSACAHKPQPSQKIGDPNVNVQPEAQVVSKSRSEALGNPDPSILRPTVDPKKCTCVQLWMPVCGDNGKTYSNSCFADCAGVKHKPGSCQKVITD